MGARRRIAESVAIRSPARLARVLVVEDEQDVAELVRYHLAKEGYDVRVSPNGADALRQVREARPDLILLDIMVPHHGAGKSAAASQDRSETRASP